MSSKGKGKGKGKGKSDPNKMTQVDRTFYELTIADLNKKLSEMRSQFSKLDESKVAATEKLRKLTEDRTDVTAYLHRTLRERNSTLRELEERLKETDRVRCEENKYSSKKIKDLETRYKAMHDQLLSEIKLLSGKLQSLDEFRLDRNKMMAQFEDQQADLRDRDNVHKEAMFLLEQKSIVEKNALKKDVELKLLQVSEDFTRSSEIRNAGYTRRLIRENIVLQQEVETLLVAQIKMKQQHEQRGFQYQEIRCNYEALDKLNKELILTTKRKLEIIENLCESCDKLKHKLAKATKYQKMYHMLMERDTCEHYEIREMSKKIRIMGMRVDALKIDKGRLIAMHETHEKEILRLRKIIQHIKLTVQGSMELKGSEDVDPQAATAKEMPPLKKDDLQGEALRQLNRRTLLEQLLFIVSSHSGYLPETPSHSSLAYSDSIYEPGKIGFLPRLTPTVIELFKRGDRKPLGPVKPKFYMKQPDTIIIPKERINEGQSVYDIEFGSSLYVTSSGDDNQVDNMEEEPLENGEEGSSSDYQSSVSVRRSKTSLTVPSSSPMQPSDTVKTGQPQSGEGAEGVAISSDAYYEEEVEGEDSLYLFF